MSHKISLFTAFLFVCLTLAANGKEVNIHVSPAGKDTYPGTRKQPLKTFQEAQRKVQESLTTAPGAKVTVYFAGGVYPLTQPMRFTQPDSGTETAPVTYQAEEGQIPVFSGSTPLTKWSVLSDKDVLNRLPSSARGKVYAANLTAAGVADLGDPTEMGVRPELSCNGTLQTLSRWPNENENAGELVQAGFTYVGELKGTTPGRDGFQEGIFEYLDPRQDKWAQESDVRLGGYWYYDWVGQYHRIAQWDAANRTVYVQPPYHNYCYANNQTFRGRYFGLNLLCELDHPGEYYIDRSKGMIYWYPPESVKPAKADVRLSVFNEPYMVEMTDCSYVRLDGLTFRESRKSGVLIRNGSHNLLSECRIERMGQNGVSISGGDNHGITGCWIHTIANNGLFIEGGDRKTLTPSYHFVEHNLMEYLSHFFLYYPFGASARGVGIRMAYNRFQFTKSIAVDFRGNDCVFEYNQLTHIGTETDENGGWDMWGDPSYRGNIARYNYFADFDRGTLHGVLPARSDDRICGVLYFGNLFERCGGYKSRSGKDISCINIHGGKENIIQNNFFFQCDDGVTFSPYYEKEWLEALDTPDMQKRLYQDVDISSELYLSRWPELAELREKIFYNQLADNLFIDCKKPTLVYYGGSSHEERNDFILKSATGDPAIPLWKILQEKNIQPVPPVTELGPKKNKWIQGFDPSLPVPYDPASRSHFPTALSTFIATETSQAPQTALNTYSGTPFHPNEPDNREPWHVPGIIECEYFDRGANGMAYKEMDERNKGASDVRPDAADVDLAYNGAAEGVVIGWAGNEEWYRYTFQVDKEGLYEIALRTSSKFGRFHITIDRAEGNVATGLSRLVESAEYAFYPVDRAIRLKPGKHVLTLQGAFINFDKIRIQEL